MLRAVDMSRETVTARSTAQTKASWQARPAVPCWKIWESSQTTTTKHNTERTLMWIVNDEKGNTLAEFATDDDARDWMDEQGSDTDYELAYVN